MINRRDGFYRCRRGKEWTIGRYYGSGCWEVLGFVDGTSPDEVGERIPGKDEPWQVVPKDLDIAMVEEFEDRLKDQGWGSDAAGEIDKQDLWEAQLSVAPSPDETP